MLNNPPTNFDVFSQLESEVRSYCRNFPAIFNTAHEAFLVDVDGKEYIDFLAGAGTLNYGHNNESILAELVEYIAHGGIIHSLDMHTKAKHDFLVDFNSTILKPRNMSYKFQFTGPTGTNAVEAALKLARKVTGRTNVAAFENGFHGVTIGALAVTSGSHYRDAAGIPLHHSIHLPYECQHHHSDTITEIEAQLNEIPADQLPAAFIVETIQGEGGIYLASDKWLQQLAALAKKLGSLLIIDDIQVGCGRVGSFFSFESSGVKPDIICLSKSLSGIGLPFAINLVRPDIDHWSPGEHNGTFRGNNLAFITARSALSYWQDHHFEQAIGQKAQLVQQWSTQMQTAYPELIIVVRGKGLIWGIEINNSTLATQISTDAFSNGLIIETCGEGGQILKILPPLTIADDVLHRGLAILADALSKAAGSK